MRPAIRLKMIKVLGRRLKFIFANIPIRNSATVFVPNVPKNFILKYTIVKYRLRTSIGNYSICGNLIPPLTFL